MGLIQTKLEVTVAYISMEKFLLVIYILPCFACEFNSLDIYIMGYELMVSGLSLS